jgi:hypothetical protein
MRRVEKTEVRSGNAEVGKKLKWELGMRKAEKKEGEKVRGWEGEKERAYSIGQRA